eukprot:3131509-Heterocapsa_arctica.AAC.1
MVAKADEEATVGSAELRAGRAKRWADWCAEQSSKGGGKLYKWIREGSMPSSFPAATRNGKAPEHSSPKTHRRA